MPHVSLDTAAGPVDMQFFIATPADNDAQRIDPSRPTVLLIHSVFIGAEIFVEQFTDPALRQCNLVAPMLRAHGTTRGPPLEESYTHQAIAEDVALFMRALQLPACHVVGLAIGANVAMELAVTHPDLVASLTLCSPLALEEPEGNIQARKEIINYWEDAFRSQIPDVPLIQDALYGSEQMTFSNRYSDVHSVRAVTKSSIDYASSNWAPEPEKLMNASVSVNRWHTARPRSGSAAWRTFFGQIRQPMQIIHFDDDVPYPLPVREEIINEFRAAGKEVPMQQVQGTCYGVLVSASDVNPLIYQFVASHSSPSLPPAAPPSGGAALGTPFDTRLAESFPIGEALDALDFDDV
ncbi:Alpha/Beta hydrolase protein [Schizophyllum amplum]|uniref:Alpha/Beta hydrolase protein n=1 Tax=Schizophyllum amplum TaxID=97359 RepID=A0A550BUG0_9AGAR|nr:Alpha/Beta hydrolase protein [Auriculariopsis ampla]